jgi:D-xylose transport system permease protein
MAIAAVVIGGTSVFGGRGGVWNALLRALAMGSIANSLGLVGAQSVVKYVAKGSIVVQAGNVDAILTRGTLFASGGQ